MKERRKRKKPSQRTRKRYLVIVIDNRHTTEKLKRAVKDFCNVDVKLICYNERKSKIMICAPRKNLNDVKAALMLSGFNCIGVSGMIKRARQKWVKE
jgi:RNase P/RNase MRP subunit POP5